MFWKLWKYEIKCSYRLYLFMYALLISAALFITQSRTFLTLIAGIIYGVMIAVTIITTFVLIIRNYNTSMFQKPGYLTLTLPVSEKKLMLVKVLSASLWLLLSYLVIIISVMIIGLRVSEISFSDIIEITQRILADFEMINNLIIINITVSLIQFVAMLFMIMNFTHSKYISHHRGLYALFIFIGLTWLISLITYRLIGSESLLVPMNNKFMNVTTTLLFEILLNGILLGSWYAGSCYFLERKIEIE